MLDGLNVLTLLARRDARLLPFWGALQEELRGRGVTTLATLRLAEFYGPASAVPLGGLDGQVDTLLFLRTVERRAQLHRLVAILKARSRPADRAVRAFRLTPAGIALDETPGAAAAILEDVARPAGGAPGAEETDAPDAPGR